MGPFRSLERVSIASNDAPLPPNPITFIFCAQISYNLHF